MTSSRTMDLKNLGDTLSRHYEKVILSVILLALLAAAAVLPFRVSQNRATIRDALDTVARIPRKETQPVDTSGMEAALQRARTDPEITLSGDHHLFNPVVWKRGNRGQIFKVVRGDEDGPGGLTVTAIRPLNFRVEFDGIMESGATLRYRFLVTDETRRTGGSRPRQVFLSEGVPAGNAPFGLTDVKGPPENPEALEIRFPEGTEVVTPEQPYQRIAGYEADLVHEKLGARFSDVRAKQPGGLRLGSETYNIVAITRDEVTLESSTLKRWTIPLKGTP